MESLIIALLVSIIIILIVCFNEVFKGKYLNKGWAVKNPIQEDLSYSTQPPRFKIEKVERTRSCNDVCWVGKYTAECWYRIKRGGVDFSRIIFYDDLNKYKVGDTLVLTPEIENN